MVPKQNRNTVVKAMDSSTRYTPMSFQRRHEGSCRIEMVQHCRRLCKKLHQRKSIVASTA